MRRVLDFIDRVLIVLCCVLLSAVTVTVLIQVVTRYVFNSPTAWSEELATLLFVWFVMLAMSPTLRHQQHIRIELLAELPLKGVKRGLGVFGNLVFAGVFVIIGYFALQLLPSASRQTMTGLTRVTSLDITLAYMYWAVPIGSVLCVIFALEQIISPPRLPEDEDDQFDVAQPQLEPAE